MHIDDAAFLAMLVFLIIIFLVAVILNGKLLTLNHLPSQPLYSGLNIPEMHSPSKT